jgi:hypothetical protein
MSKKFSDDWTFKAGMAIFGIVVAISVMYWMGMLHEMFKMDPAQEMLLAVCAGIGAVAGAVMAAKARWWLAVVPGALAGAGGFQLFEWYVVWLERESVYKLEVILVCLAGAVPGLLLYLFLNKIISAKQEAV